MNFSAMQQAQMAEGRKPSVLARLEKLEAQIGEVTDAIERLGGVLQRACQEIGIDARERP